MTFADPAFLAALLLVPIALGAYLLVQRRRQRYVVRFTNVDLLTNLVPRTPSGRTKRIPVQIVELGHAGANRCLVNERDGVGD